MKDFHLPVLIGTFLVATFLNGCVNSEQHKAKADQSAFTVEPLRYAREFTIKKYSTFKVLEEGSNVLSKEENSQLAARQQKFIRDLESALLRIENKTYGVCRVTGKLIPKERLLVVPHATMSIEAKLLQQKK